ncbi:uncharacterized protein KY384_005760 [Bacidia gigantensis]|uniref:uncharacterized protein n=1 Tax=Bacidia gigantensis TaxID=2732470 RepID=UPI001D05BE18|nr:uncharacterized protein KY384_005760 [Bacidia gigantensis]KAG8529125.1 hypothetical protein KY384_005760 [Bacidia gigantensis]
MAEPISIIASAVTVTGAAITVADTVLSFILQLQNAPHEIAFLQNDVIDTRLILSNIKDNTGENQSLDRRLAIPGATGPFGNPEIISNVEYSIKRIERILLQIQVILRHVTKSRGLGRTTIHHRQWVLHRLKMRSLRQELQELKTSVAVHFSANSSVVLLKRILLENAETVQRQTERSDEFNATLQGLVQRLAEYGRIPEIQRQLAALAENLNSSVVTLEQRSRLTTTTVTKSAPVISIPYAANKGSENLDAELPCDFPPATTSTTVSTESVSKLKLEFSRFQKRGCVSECVCTCHQRKKYRSPSFAQKVLGEIFIGFSNLPLLSTGCSDTRCTQKSPFSATLTYYLPTLFLRKMLSLVLITTSQGDPAACFKVRPISSDFSIYRAVEGNDVRTVRKMIGSRQSHASATFKGLTLLTMFRSPLELAWIKILGKSFEHETQQEMEQIFSDRDCLEEMGFSILHQIVLGIKTSSLVDYISNNPGCVNNTDSHGRTALSWAAQRGMLETVKSLLEFGANPNLCTPRGHSPLMYAAEARNPDCLQPLLEKGADVTQCDVEGQTPLHYAAGHRSDLAYYRPLMEGNSDPNWATIPGMTPLTTVILEGHNDAMEYLVEKGADTNLKGHDERSPAFYAVEYNNVPALKYLFGKGANFTGASLSYPSIAHVAAYHAKVETLRVLTAFRLTLRDVDCVDNEGLAIPQIVDKRLRDGLNVEEDFAHAFGKFLKSVGTEEMTKSDDDEGEEDEFHDAVEQIVA